MHVGENEEAQLPPHVHGVHSKVVLEPGDGDESVQLKGGSRQVSLCVTGTSADLCEEEPRQTRRISYIFVHHLSALRGQRAAVGHGQVGHGVRQDGLARKPCCLRPRPLAAVCVTQKIHTTSSN